MTQVARQKEEFSSENSSAFGGRMGTIDGLPPLREVIRAHDLVAKKQLGQNFLLDLNLTAKIARSAGDLAGCDVLEVGPGPGGLTRGLLTEGARRVVAVEKDARCLPALAEIAAAYPGRLSVVQGDALEPAIIAASILAKVERDRLMVAMEDRYPGYGFAQHKGYPTPEHLAALKLLGPCVEHRRRFAPVRALLAPPLF